jgi:G protein-coupled receptor Mth (Methuselah protein)
MISLPFLLATFLIYGCTPELRNLHGKSLMCYIVGLTIFYIGIIVVNMDKKLYNGTWECKFVSFLTYMGVLSCFFWLNVMCYDIWSAFKVGMRTQGSDQKRFLLYSTYAYGVPIIFTLCVYAIDLSDLIPHRFRPQMGVNRCWFHDSKIIEAIYVYFPISIVLAINIVLYSITARTIHRVQRETSIVRRGDSQRHSKMNADKDKFILYLRLFIVMGSTWLMESISFFFETPYIFYVTDILNCLQGLLIFILFVWKPKVKKILLKR